MALPSLDLSSWIFTFHVQRLKRKAKTLTLQTLYALAVSPSHLNTTFCQIKSFLHRLYSLHLKQVIANGHWWSVPGSWITWASISQGSCFLHWQYDSSPAAWNWSIDCDGLKSLEFPDVFLILAKVQRGFEFVLRFLLPVPWVYLVDYECFQIETYWLICLVVCACDGVVDRSDCMFSMRTVDGWSHWPIDLPCGVCWDHLGTHTHPFRLADMLSQSGHMTSLFSFLWTHAPPTPSSAKLITQVLHDF